MIRACRLLGPFGLAAAALAACSPAAPAHDKAVYAANATRRAQQLAACQADPGRLGASADCVNAQAAGADSHTQHFYDVAKPTSRVAQPGNL